MSFDGAQHLVSAAAVAGPRGRHGLHTAAHDGALGSGDQRDPGLRGWLARVLDAVSGTQPGWWKTPSSSRCGTPRTTASDVASVDFPDPEFPTTDTRRTTAQPNTKACPDDTRFPSRKSERRDVERQSPTLLASDKIPIKVSTAS